MQIKKREKKSTHGGSLFSHKKNTCGEKKKEKGKNI